MIELRPKTLERIRDQLLEVGQPASVHFMHPAADEPFAGDPEAKRRFEALFEAMYLMMVADGEIADTEREVLRGAVLNSRSNGCTAHIEMFETCGELAKQGARALPNIPILRDRRSGGLFHFGRGGVRGIGDAEKG
jgi:hypothetical protein